MLASLLCHRRAFTPSRPLALGAALLALAAPVASLQAAPYSQLIVFGDSLSDDGNDTHLTNDKFDVKYPGLDFNYSNGRFTDDISGTSPASANFEGVWHEQLTRRFLGLTRASDSLDGGTDYAYGDATTEDGTTTIDVVSIPVVGDVTLTIENMGQQVTDYLTAVNGTADSNALFSVWGGANDLFNDDSAANVTATANRVGALVTRLAQAGARNFIVPNVPPLGDTPEYNSGDPATAAALNAASASYATQLDTVLDSTISALSAQGITVTIARLDVYTFFMQAVAQPAAYGFTNVTDSAQGANVPADDYLFWDDVHPTTSGHSQVAQLAADLLSGGHPAFFSGETALAGDYFYLAFPDGQEFGYYSYEFFPYLYHTDLGFEYVIAANDAANGAYLYDFGLQTFLYTSPTLYPYLYNFNAGAFYYFFYGEGDPSTRAFYNFGTSQYVYSAN